MTVIPVAEMRRCSNCETELPSDETVCRTCKPRRRILSVIWGYVLRAAKVSAVISIFTALWPAGIWWLERNSYTQITVASADPNHVILNVLNLGRQPSKLRACRLLFDGLPGKEKALDFSYAARLAGSSVIQAGACPAGWPWPAPPTCAGRSAPRRQVADRCADDAGD